MKIKEIINEIDKINIQLQQIIKDFEAFRTEAGEDKVFQAMSTMIGTNEQHILMLLKALGLSTTEFDANRMDSDWEK